MQYVEAYNGNDRITYSFKVWLLLMKIVFQLF